MAVKVKVQDTVKQTSRSKRVNMCRSGYQTYTRAEVEAQGLKPSVVKDSYVEYRPSGVVVDAIEKFKFIPITKEHPSTWVNDYNRDTLVKGNVGDSINIVPVGDEIGLQANLIFTSKDVEDYYKRGSKEVSVGYTATKEMVTDSSLPYDIILKSIDTVNHLAVTARGRGGKQVAILDSLIQGGQNMNWLQKMGIIKPSGSDEATFGELVFDALTKTKGMVNDSEIKSAMEPFQKMVSALPEGEKRENLKKMVTDAFEQDLSKEELTGAKDQIVDALDAAYDLVQDSDADSDKDKDEGKKPSDKGGKGDKDEKGEEGKEGVNDTAPTLESVHSELQELKKLMAGVQDSVSQNNVQNVVKSLFTKDLDNQGKGGVILDSNSNATFSKSLIAKKIW